ncbi:MAG: hypothetical protein ABSC37_07605 [Xanthobacteraceae bacterium]|jgi:hypothetical protein
MRPEDILALTPAGVRRKRGSFHIDPTRPVETMIAPIEQGRPS